MILSLLSINSYFQRTLAALSESHLLADRHLNSSLKSAEEVTRLKTDLEETKRNLDTTADQLESCQVERGTIKKEKENVESDLMTKVSFKDLFDWWF